MAISESWTDPDSLDRATGEILTEVIWDGVVSDLAYLGGQTATGVVASKRIGLPVDNSTGGSLAAGTLVYISGYDASTGAPQITKSDADSRQAEYVLNAAIANGAAGVVYRGYTLGSLDTSGSSVGDPIYLSATAGSWTATALTGSAQLSQKVGVVVTSHASTGSIVFDLPGEILKIGSGQLQSGAAGGGGYTPTVVLTTEFVQPAGGGPTSVGSNNNAVYCPINIPGDMTITKIAIKIGTSSGNIDVGIYDKAGTLQIATGSIASPGTGIRWITVTSTALSAGQHWIAIASSNTTITFFHGSTGGGVGQDTVAIEASDFPLPSTFTPPSIPSGTTGRTAYMMGVA